MIRSSILASKHLKIISRNIQWNAFKSNQNLVRKPLLKLSIFGGVSFGAYMYHNTSNEAQVLDAAEHGSEIDQNSKKWTLYQYATCPFCCKVRTFLDYYDIDYEIVEVNPVTRKEIKFSDYRKVPFMRSSEHQLNDSSLICSVLKSHLITDGDISKILSYYPVLENPDEKKKSHNYQNRYNVMYETGLSKENHEMVKNEMKWRKWVDEVFVHTLSPNIYRTAGESLQAMEYITKVGNFSKLEQNLIYYSGAVAMYLIGKRLKHRHHLRNEVRESLYEEAFRWLKAVGKSPFHGGEKPNLADLNMYGVLSAIEGYDAFNDLLQNTDIGPWYERMKTKVNNKEGVKEVSELRTLLGK